MYVVYALFCNNHEQVFLSKYKHLIRQLNRWLHHRPNDKIMLQFQASFKCISGVHIFNYVDISYCRLNLKPVMYTQWVFPLNIWVISLTLILCITNKWIQSSPISTFIAPNLHLWMDTKALDHLPAFVCKQFLLALLLRSASWILNTSGFLFSCSE